MGKCYSRFSAVFKPNSRTEGAGAGADLADSSSAHLTALPKPPSAAESAETPSLQVLGVDFLIGENGVPHHTSEFELMERTQDARLVIRRGQAFVIQISLNRALQPSQDAVSFIFTLHGLKPRPRITETRQQSTLSLLCCCCKGGPCSRDKRVEKPTHGHGTLVALPLLDAGTAPSSPDAWNATIEKNLPDSKSVRVLITPSAACIVGHWRMEVDTKSKTEGGPVSYEHPHPFIVLFNPWCKDDTVYLESEPQRQEYVFNDTGLIWRGSYNRLRPTVWHYAQFEKDVLECALYLAAEIGKLSPHTRADAVRTSRAISAAVNSPDDNGALMGNWSDDYSGGTAPIKWVGSMQIMQQFWKNKKPVKYGQCWVFAGVVTTICRALGIPSRPVTNYSSAHDTQSSLTVDYFVNEKAEIMEELNSDSIWNFHVWNEVWMARPDLGDMYSGWQVIDATPQEQSDEMYRCGPSSVTAIKRGEVLKQFDGAFVYAEVNADKVYWRYNGPTQPLKLLRKDMKGIGRCISTKAVGSTFRDDITEFYKYPEESKEERAAMLTALRQSASLFSRYYLNEDFNDMHFDFELRDDIVIGMPFSVVLVMKNRSRTKDYTVNVTLRVDTVTYTGRMKDPVKLDKAQRLVKGGAVEEIRMDVSYNEYASHLVDQCSFNIACMASVSETNFEYFAQDDFRVRKPDIKFKLLNEPVEGQEVKATISLTNPLPVPLRKGQFTVEGPGLSQLKLKIEDELASQAVGSKDFVFTPHFAGKKTLSAKFIARELDDVDGFLEFMVKPAATTEQPNGDTPAPIAAPEQVE